MSQRQFFSHVLFAAILLVNFSSFGMEEVNNCFSGYPNSKNEDSNPGYFNPQSITFDINNDNNSQSEPIESNEALEFGNLNDKFDPKLFEESYSKLPADLCNTIERYADPLEPTFSSKTIALVGPTGSGKSIAARAMAWKMNRSYLFISSTNLLGSILHKGVENVRGLFEQLRKFRKLPVLILDEVNYLGDDYVKGNSDAKFTIAHLWSELDSLELRKDFFLIVTGNDFKNLPHPFQDRLCMYFYELAYIPLTPQIFKAIINKYERYKRANDCDDNFLTQLAQKAQPFSTRVINAMVDAAVTLAWKRGDKTITAQDLNAACDKALLNREKFCDFKPHIVPEERRHQETLAQNRELSDRSYNQSTTQHRASIRQNNAHHAENYAQSRASHAQSAAQHVASEQLSIDLHNASQRQSVALQEASQEFTEYLQNVAQIFQVRQGIYQAWLHDKDTVLTASNATLPFVGLAAAGIARLAAGSNIDAYLAFVNPAPIVHMNQRRENVNGANPRNINQRN